MVDALDHYLPDSVKQYLRDHDLPARLAPRNGFYPRLGGLTTGSGLAGGAGYRHHLFDDRLLADASGVVSYKAYVAVDLKARWLRFWDNRGEVWTAFRYGRFPQEDFFGIGSAASRQTRTDFHLNSTDVTTRALVRVIPSLTLGAELGHYRPDLGRGRDDAIPSIEEVFTDADAPGLGGPQPRFLHMRLSATFDRRDHPGNPHRGGMYRAAIARWDDRTRGTSDFDRLDLDGLHAFPVGRRADTVVVAGQASYTTTGDGDRVPFYLLPYIGGADTLRGYHEFRFRAPNAASISVEYRWEAFPFVQIAPFVDLGDVGARWQDVDFRHPKASAGVGFRLHTSSSIVARLDLGFSEGAHVFLKFAAPF